MNCEWCRQWGGVVLAAPEQMERLRRCPETSWGLPQSCSQQLALPRSWEAARPGHGCGPSRPVRSPKGFRSSGPVLLSVGGQSLGARSLGASEASEFILVMTRKLWSPCHLDGRLFQPCLFLWPLLVAFLLTELGVSVNKCVYVWEHTAVSVWMWLPGPGQLCVVSVHTEAADRACLGRHVPHETICELSA